ncbi:hypothetical protein ABXT70_12875 [Candidatus Njordibacter sp. Uisw_039]|jgi:hypothetical protein|uniref:hypothetical protein n=1 Tax=Candidatus Njordibacter sp. Uisw_039 TaxID=3230972 RepID=UPI003D4614DC
MSQDSLRKSGIIYGVTIYWLTIAGAVIVLLGSFLALGLGWTVMPVSEQLNVLLQGNSLSLDSRINSGDMLIQLGLGLAIFAIVPAILIGVPGLWRSGFRMIALCGCANVVLIIGAFGVCFASL